jgi:hypothetical protein
MSQTYSVGFAVSVIWDLLGNLVQKKTISELLNHLSSFEVDGLTANNGEKDPILAIANNIIERGQPSWP